MLSEILIILAVVFILTAVHEAGHYMMGRFYGVHPDLVEVGFGPVIFKKGIFSLRLIPCSGRVNHPDDEVALLSPGEIKMIAAAGPLSNFVFAMLLLPIIFFGLGGQLLYFIFVLNIIMGFGNLIPISIRGLGTDGSYVFGLLKP